MRWARFHTQAGRDVFEGVRFRTVATDERLEYVVPGQWNQAAVDILLEKIFYAESLPAITRRVEEPGVPAFLWRSEVDDTALDSISAEWRYHLEKDIRDVLHRVAGALTYRAWKNKFLSTEEEARIFYDELRHVMIHQVAAPELKQWALLGLDWAYGLTGISFAPSCRISDFSPDAKNVMKRIKILGETLALEEEETKTNVTLPVEDFASPDFIAWKRNRDIREVTEAIGRKTLQTAIYHVMDACDRDSFFGFDPARNMALRKAVEEARQAGLSDSAVRLAISYAEQGFEEIGLTLPEEDRTAEQCVKTTVSVPDAFIEAALTGHGFLLYEGAEPKRHASAEKLWNGLAEAIWSSGEPAVSFRDSVEAGNPMGRPLACDAGGGFIFLPGSTAPAATVNLMACARGRGILDVDAVRHVTRLMVVALDAVAAAEYRPLLLGVTNVAALLMGKGIAYDSDAGRVTAALAAAYVSGVAHLTSAEMAAEQGAFSADPVVTKSALQKIKDKIAVLSGTAFLQKGMTRRPVQMRAALCPDADLPAAAKRAWESAYDLGRETGFRHAHLTGMETEPAVQALLGAQTQDIMPEAALVRFEGYFSDTLEGAALYGKKLNPMAPSALAQLGYSVSACEDMHFYAVGHGTLLDAPHINHKTLREKGFHQAALDALEQALATAQHIRYAFNKWTLGAEFCRRVLGFSAEDLERGTFDILSAMGFSEDHIEAANIYCCGTMTLEGAPHLKPAHLGVFDCIAPCGTGVRRVSPEAQIKMQAAVEPFLSGAVAHTVVLGHHATIEQVQKLVLTGWELGVKNLRLYRDGCSLLYPVALPLGKNIMAEEEETATCPKQSMTA